MKKTVIYTDYENKLVDALFPDKEYTVIHESEENYLIQNEVRGIGIYSKSKFKSK